jgi:4-carboxymuconolactone decarboxylase
MIEESEERPMTERLNRLHPDQLDADQQAVYASITGGPRASTKRVVRLADDDGGLFGPFNAWLLSPPMGAALDALGAAIRFSSSFDARLRELAILVTANHFTSEFELFAHEALGRDAGITDDEINALRQGEVPGTCSSSEVAALQFVQSVLRAGDSTDDQYDRAVEAVGVRGAFELTTLVGFYSLVAMQLRLYRVEPPPT